MHMITPRGIFSDAQIKDRALLNWEGDWQSVYPYLQVGTLNIVMEQEAARGSKTAEEYWAGYDIGYETDVDGIVIDDASVTFHRGGQAVTGQYEDDGYEVLTYVAATVASGMSSRRPAAMTPPPISSSSAITASYTKR